MRDVFLKNILNQKNYFWKDIIMWKLYFQITLTMLKLIFIFVMISFVTQEGLGQIPITDYDEVYSCDKIPSELRVLLISPQQYYLYEGWVNIWKYIFLQ